MANIQNSAGVFPYSFDVREDEEQHAKLENCIELFVASGYFRARMKGLHAFDTIVGGLAWAIEICNYEADIDIFHDSLSIGQKIALTEKIVATLKEMHCPHRIEPHQIQGLDFIHIYPVVQWLIKQTLEHRALVAQRVRSSGVEQFLRVTDVATQETRTKNNLGYFCNVWDIADSTQDDKPRRRRYYKWTGRSAELDALPNVDDEKLVRMTLFEYSDASRQENHIEQGQLLSSSTQVERSTDDFDETQMQTLLAEGGLKKAGIKLKPNKIGRLIAESSPVIEKLAGNYAAERERIKEVGVGYAGTPTQKLRLLEKRVAAHRQRVEELEQRERELRVRYDEVTANHDAAQTRKQQLQQAVDAISAQIDEAKRNDKSPSSSSMIEVQVKQYEDLKRQNQLFKKECKSRAADLEAEIDHLRKQCEHKAHHTDANQREQIILQRQLDSSRESLAATRSKLAVVSRELGALQRQRDAVPGPAEINQYQRRFIELYEEVNTWHRQLRQLYSIYNQCQDSMQFYEKEIGLFDSINDNFRKILDNDDATAAARLRESLLLQLRETVASVLRNVAGADMALSKALAKREQASRDYAAKLDEQRRHANMLREFQYECTRNEQLLVQVEAASAATVPVLNGGKS